MGRSVPYAKKSRTIYYGPPGVSIAINILVLEPKSAEFSKSKEKINFF
jgi:hypothetical protein